MVSIKKISLLCVAASLALLSTSVRANDTRTILVSDLDSGFMLEPDVSEYLAVDFLAAIRRTLTVLPKSWPVLDRNEIGVDPHHGTRVLRRIALGIKPNERARVDRLRLVPIVFADDIAASYRLAIQNGVLIHNFSVGIDPSPAADKVMHEMDAVVRSAPEALFVVAVGNEGVEEVKTLGKFPQKLALDHLPNVIFAGNARDTEFFKGTPYLGTLESPYEIRGSNWTEASRFYVCLGCESTTGASAYLSRLLAYIEQSLLLNRLPHQNSNALKVLERCLPRAHFKYVWEAKETVKGRRFFFRPTGKFLREAGECAAHSKALVTTARPIAGVGSKEFL